MMKRNSILMAMLLAAATFGFTACSSDDDKKTEEETPTERTQQEDDEAEVTGSQMSPCKVKVTQEKGAPATSRASVDEPECIELAAKDGGYLNLKHANEWITCCTEEIKVSVKQTDNVITVSESATDPTCNCVCAVDVESTIGPLTEGKEYMLVYNREVDSEIARVSFTYGKSLSDVIAIGKK